MDQILCTYIFYSYTLAKRLDIEPFYFTLLKFGFEGFTQA